MLLLTTEVLMKYMGFKLGPALKLASELEKLKEDPLYIEHFMN
jgi:hypothetical protein